MRTRKAILPDVQQIYDVILHFSQEGALLPRSLAELCENIRDFVVVEMNGRVVGCGALHLYGQHLAEVRSIAVLPELQGTGGGRKLIRALLAEASRQKVSCVCLFTRVPGFFSRLGFVVARREDLPDKIYKDCVNCPKLHACDEIAMYRGELPNMAILEPPGIDVPLQSLGLFTS